MRKMTSILGSVLLAGVAACGFTAAASGLPVGPGLQLAVAQAGMATDPPDQRSVAVRQVTVVAVDQLSGEQRRRVDESAAETSPEDLTRLRNAIDAMPELSSALESFGVTSSQVVAVDIDGDGLLTLFVTA